MTKACLKIRADRKDDGTLVFVWVLIQAELKLVHVAALTITHISP